MLFPYKALGGPEHKNLRLKVLKLQVFTLSCFLSWPHPSLTGPAASTRSHIPIALGRKFIHDNSCIYDNRVNVYTFTDIKSVQLCRFWAPENLLRPGTGWWTLGSELLSGCHVYLPCSLPVPSPFAPLSLGFCHVIGDDLLPWSLLLRPLFTLPI